MVDFEKPGDNVPALNLIDDRVASYEVTLKVAEGLEPASVFPAWSPALPAMVEIPNVPTPVIADMVTV